MASAALGVEVVSNIYAAFGQGKIEDVIAACTDDVHFPAGHTPPNAAEAAGISWIVPRQGKDEVLLYFKALDEAVVTQKFEVVRLLGTEEGVVLAWINEKLQSKVKPDKEAELQVLHEWHINAEGKATALKMWADTAKLLDGWGA